ncbi:MAG: MFS transporter, partial [Pseudomonadota bacterium]|nr:MFS transporter [Pseudomonadota bacterium]
PFYIMVVIYIFFPYFSGVVVGDPVKGQSIIGYINASVGFVLAATILFLGAIADKIGRRKPWIVATYGVIAVGAMLLWWVQPPGAGLSLNVSIGLIFLIMVAFAYAEVFHNAMLPSVTPADKAGQVSGLAFALGNFGGVSMMVFVLFAFALPGVQDWNFLPSQPLFGIDQSVNEHDRIVGPIAGIWLVLFTLPVLLFTPDGRSSGVTWQQAARAGLGEVLATLRQLIKHYSNIAVYLLARMLFNDGMVGVLIFGGVYAAGNFGWETITLLIFGLTTSVSAMIGAFVGGLLDDRLGSMRTLKVSILMSAIILLVLTSITPDTLFFAFPVSTEAVWSFPYFSSVAELTYLATNQIFALFFVTGLSASRTLMAKLSPPEMATQFFGLYGLSGSVTAFLAPLLVAVVTDISQSQRVGFASLVILILIGGLMLGWVREEQATRAPD